MKGKIVVLCAALAASPGCDSNLVVDLGDAGFGGGAAGGAGGGGVAVSDGGCVDRDKDGYGTGQCLGPDCDDSNPAITANTEAVACFTFDAGLTGACHAGTAKCTNGVPGECLNQAGPSLELCNGLDDDCNKVIDDGVTTQVCYTGRANTRDAGPLGICSSGFLGCSIDGGAQACVGEVTPTLEVCNNGKDDDCNGVVDDATCAGGTYVCPGCLGAEDSNPGTQTAPVSTIRKGILHAVALRKQLVYVAGTANGLAQTYSEDLIIPNGVIVQGRWVVSTATGTNGWQRTGIERTVLNNTSANGVKFVPGATAASGIDGISIQAVASNAAPLSVGVAIVDASPLLKDFAVVGATLAAGESIGVLIAGVGAAPRLEGTTALRSEIAAGPATERSSGVRVTDARLTMLSVNVRGGHGAWVLSTGLYLKDAPLSLIKDSSLSAGLSTACVGAFSQGNAGGVKLINVTATGCPAPAAGVTTQARSAAGIAFEGCPQVSAVGPAEVTSSTVIGGITNGTDSIAVGAATVDGCDVKFIGNTVTGGQLDAINVPGTQIGVYCGFAGQLNPNGLDSPCRVFGNTIGSGSANAPTSVGVFCQGTCGNGSASCRGSCAEIADNTIIATAGGQRAHLSVVDSSPLITRNRLGMGASPVSAACATGAVVGLNLEGSGATVVNNLIAVGACPYAVGIHQKNTLRKGDNSIAAPTVHFNTVTSSGPAAGAATTLSYAALFTSAVISDPAVPNPKGIWRNNILVSGPSGAVVRENDLQSEPAVFWNNLLHQSSTIPVLYIDEGITKLFTDSAVNAMTVVSSQANFKAEPGFVNPLAGDLNLSPNSAARGAGNATGAPVFDFDGDPRPNPAGSLPDVGAHEVP